MVELDIAKLRAATAELGYQPATTDDEHLKKLRADNERHRKHNKNADFWLARSRRFDHLKKPR